MGSGRRSTALAFYEHRPIDPTAEHLRDRRFRDDPISLHQDPVHGRRLRFPWVSRVNPFVLLPVGGADTLAFLSCSTCLPSWEISYVPIDKPPWSVVNHKGNDRFKCPGCGKAVALSIRGPRGDRLAAQSSRLTGPRRLRRASGD